jgi:uncharacterized membrane protein SpoIIM required for sporulation
MAKVDASVKELEASQRVMLAEASSADPYTSRARPSFLYVVYLLILWALPMSIVFVVNPDLAKGICQGFNLWLAAIPKPLIDLFTVVMTGYVVGRSYEKTKGVK